MELRLLSGQRIQDPSFPSSLFYVSVSGCDLCYMFCTLLFCLSMELWGFCWLILHLVILVNLSVSVQAETTGQPNKVYHLIRYPMILYCILASMIVFSASHF
ncbi:hypothetical protein SAY86_006421 [Trapa natans]|uniref:Uncharacterized protein n=1 Tax=Trapa natans TaxID=22666 RepID=A0AAN7QXL9_TRANT|nr:hypothetical protein SAY86_006421 [Trapa natans]